MRQEGARTRWWRRRRRRPLSADLRFTELMRIYIERFLWICSFWFSSFLSHSLFSLTQNVVTFKGDWRMLVAVSLCCCKKMKRYKNCLFFHTQYFFHFYFPIFSASCLNSILSCTDRIAECRWWQTEATSTAKTKQRGTFLFVFFSSIVVVVVGISATVIGPPQAPDTAAHCYSNCRHSICTTFTMCVTAAGMKK